MLMQMENPENEIVFLCRLFIIERTKICEARSDERKRKNQATVYLNVITLQL
jgi:hypothetical protein